MTQANTDLLNRTTYRNIIQEQASDSWFAQLLNA